MHCVLVGDQDIYIVTCCNFDRMFLMCINMLCTFNVKKSLY